MDPVSGLIDHISKKAAGATIGQPTSSSTTTTRSRPGRPLRRPRDVRRCWPQVLALLKTSGKVRKVRRTEYGFSMNVWLGRHAADALQGNAREIASIFRVMAIEAEPHTKDVSQATLRLFQRDLLEELRPWPGLTAETVSGWDPVELGWDRLGEDLRLEMTDRPHLLVVGQTRAGKSVCMAMFAATAALSGDKLFLFDRNRKDLAPWAPLAEEFVVSDMQHAARVLDFLVDELDRRFKLIADAGEFKLDRELSERLDLPLIWLLIDEGTFYLKVKTKPTPANPSGTFVDALADLFSRGAAAGLRGVFGMQHPHSNVIPTSFRGQMQRVAFRMQDGAGSRLVLDTSVVDASEILRSQQGVCYVDRDGHGLTKARMNYLAPDDIRGLVERAAKMRGIRL